MEEGGLGVVGGWGKRDGWMRLDWTEGEEKGKEERIKVFWVEGGRDIIERPPARDIHIIWNQKNKKADSPPPNPQPIPCAGAEWSKISWHISRIFMNSYKSMIIY